MQLHPDQAEGVRRALAPGITGFLLFCEQRVGKTPMACKIIEKRRPKRLLIVCPKIAIDVWEAHLVQFDIPSEVKIVNFEQLSRQKKKLRKWKPDMVVGDEIHRVKGRSSQQSRALRLISNDRTCLYRLGLTGTPIESKIEDAWAQFDFADRRVFGPWSSKPNSGVVGFKDRYLIYGGFRGKKVVGVKNRAEYERKFHSISYRVRLEDVKEVKTEIAPDNLVTFDLQESAPHYRSMEKAFMVELVNSRRWVRVKKVNPRTGEVHFVKRRKHKIIAPLVITQAMKLHQLAGGFIMDEEKNTHRVGDEKLTAFGCLMLSIPNPLVIFVRFIPELKRIEALCRALGRTVKTVWGKNKYDGVFDTDVIIVQIRSGIAIDLARAEDAVFYSWNHSFIDYSQALFRIRSRTSKRASYHFMIARGTVDEQLYEAATTKKNFSKMIVDKFTKH